MGLLHGGGGFKPSSTDATSAFTAKHASGAAARAKSTLVFSLAHELPHVLHMPALLPTREEGADEVDASCRIDAQGEMLTEKRARCSNEAMFEGAWIQKREAGRCSEERTLHTTAAGAAPDN